METPALSQLDFAVTSGVAKKSVFAKHGVEESDKAFQRTNLATQKLPYL